MLMTSLDKALFQEGHFKVGWHVTVFQVLIVMTPQREQPVGLPSTGVTMRWLPHSFQTPMKQQTPSQHQLKSAC